MKVIGVDPGFSGAICVLDGSEISIYDIPLIEEKKKVKGKIRKKRRYDSVKIVEIIKSHLDEKDDSLCCIELVHSNPGEGFVSSFNFGKGVGILEGILTAIVGSEPAKASPQSWKKEYPELNTPKIKKLREKQRKLRVNLKVLVADNKTVKDKKLKNGNKIKIKDVQREVDKLGREIKSLSKDASRAVASKVAPKWKHLFKLKKHDGRAESLLIANYLRDNYELVQEGE